MTSERKIAANRINSRKSRGPRTAAGKARASRNALRHGLATISHLNPVHGGEIEQRAQSFCNGDPDPSLQEQAMRIAECDLVLRCVRVEQVAAIERLHTPTAIALARQNKCMAFAKAWADEAMLAFEEYHELEAKIAAKIAKYGFSDADDELGQGMRWEIVPELHWRRLAIDSRDEFGAMYEAMPDLDRLGRYERRAWSRRKRAVRELLAIKARRADDCRNEIERDASA